MGTAIVLGATGLVGRELVEQLVASPRVERVVTLTRRPSPHASSKVANHVVDFDDPASFAHLVQGNWLFSALGTTLKQAGSVAAQRVVDVDYQREVAKIAAENGMRHYLLVSSGMADANSRSPYLQMKGELEDAVKALDFPRVSVFRPGPLTGPRTEFRPAGKLTIFLSKALHFLPGLGNLRPISDKQVAKKMIAISQSDGPARQMLEGAALFTNT